MKANIHELPKIEFRRICGVYQLYQNDCLIYIGKSTDINTRIISHAKDKNFTHYSFIECEPSNLNEIEASLIKRHLPELNKCMNEKHVKEKRNLPYILAFDKKSRRTRKYYDVFSVKKRYPYADTDKIENLFKERNRLYRQEDDFVILY